MGFLKYLKTDYVSGLKVKKKKSVTQLKSSAMKTQDINELRLEQINIGIKIFYSFFRNTFGFVLVLVIFLFSIFNIFQSFHFLGSTVNQCFKGFGVVEIFNYQSIRIVKSRRRIVFIDHFCS